MAPKRTVIHPSSGSIGSEGGEIQAARGYDVEIVMPDNLIGKGGGEIDAIRAAAAEINFVR